MNEDIAARADRLFETAYAFSRDDAKTILAEHSATGLLRSGATIKRVTTAFAERSCKALDEALASVAARVDHRGSKWRKMLREVDLAIDDHMDLAPQFIYEFTSVAGPNTEKLVTPILDDIRSSLHQRLADYRDGWTAPPGKPWRERNAVLYAVLLVLAGAVAGEVVKLAFSWPPPAVETVKPPSSKGAPTAK